MFSLGSKETKKIGLIESKPLTLSGGHALFTRPIASQLNYVSQLLNHLETPFWAQNYRNSDIYIGVTKHCKA